VLQSSVSLAQPKNRLGPRQNLGFSFGSVFIENRSFSFRFKTDTALLMTVTHLTWRLAWHQHRQTDGQRDSQTWSTG